MTTPSDLASDLARTTAEIRVRAGSFPAPIAGVVLGSGLAGFADLLTDPIAIPYAELPGFPASSVPGHPGRLVLGKIAGRPIAVLQGRCHLYEGYTPAQVVFPARTLAALGARHLIVTNASGGIRADLMPGDLMLISDQINLSGRNPLTGPNDDRVGPRFPDMTEAYHPELRALADRVARELDVPLKRGVYACLSGPSYETPAEIRMLRTLGADAVGMSTVLETIAAVHRGVKVLGISCITNHAAGIGHTPLSHEEVARTAARVGERFGALLCGILAQLS